jgi:hypothetical protein
MTAGAHAAKPARRWVGWVGLAVAVAIVAFIGLFAWDFWQLKQASADLRSHASAAQAAISARDSEALVAEVDAVQSASQRFAAATSGPHWWIADHVPWVSAQSVPLHTAGAAVLAISEGALEPLSELDDLSALQAPKIENGHIDPYILEPYRETLAQAASVMAAQQRVLVDVSLSGTVSQVREPYLELLDNMETLGGTVQGAHVAAELLPAMLGADGPRTYLVMVQNNAEPRATGGIPGAVLELTVDDGTIAFEKYVSAASLNRADVIPGPLTDDEDRIFGERMLRYAQDVNFTPEYSRSALLISQFWERAYGETVDGVLSIDPVALGYMLQGMPSMEIGGITVTADNVASVMLNESYLTFPDPDDSDAFFALASQTLFGLLASGETSSVAGVEQAIDESRFLVWSTDESEQQLLDTTPVAGNFLDRAGTVGLFINDGSGSKIGYYVDVDTTVTNHMCPDGSLAGQTITITFAHTFDGDVDDLPRYVNGGGVFVSAGEFQASVLLYPAAGTGVTGLTVDGEAAQLQPEKQNGRSMSNAWLTLAPGETSTFIYEVVANEQGLLAPSVTVTPGPVEHGVEVSQDAASEGC